MAGMKLMPPRRLMLPKVKRGYPRVTSIPTVERRSPKRALMVPFTGAPEASKAAPLRPMTASQKYSKEVKLVAMWISQEAPTMKARAPRIPPIAEHAKSSARTREPLPCLVSS
jgi:hypothetical protein